MRVPERIHLFLLLTAGLLAAALPAFGYDTERVIIVVIDGPRLSETFEEPGQIHIPTIWNQLVPAGCYLAAVSLLLLPVASVIRLALGQQAITP